MTRPKLYRLPAEQRFARVVVLRGQRVRVITREGWTYQGRLLAVGRALHGTSTDWLALEHPRSDSLDRFVSLATIETMPEAQS